MIKPRGIRNNNPGNLKLRPSKTRPGYKGSDKDGYSVFDTPEHGLDSLARLLVDYGRRGFDTIAKIVNRYAPPSENDTAAYANYLSIKLKLETKAGLALDSPAMLADLMAAMIFFENGQCPYSYDVIKASAESAVKQKGKKP